MITVLHGDCRQVLVNNIHAADAERILRAMNETGQGEHGVSEPVCGEPSSRSA